MNSEHKHTKSFTPFTIMRRDKYVIFSCWGFTSGLFITESGFDGIMLPVIGWFCDSISNQFFYANSFSFLLIFMVGELGSEELE